MRPEQTMDAGDSPCSKQVIDIDHGRKKLRRQAQKKKPPATDPLLPESWAEPSPAPAREENR
jgi:hypothetical protein